MEKKLKLIQRKIDRQLNDIENPGEYDERELVELTPKEAETVFGALKRLTTYKEYASTRSVKGIENLKNVIQKLTYIKSDAKKLDYRLFEKLVEIDKELLNVYNSIETRWITVGERLPKDSKTILLFTKNRGRIAGYFLDGYFYTGEVCLFDKVTHWQPLPEPPTK